MVSIKNRVGKVIGSLLSAAEYRDTVRPRTTIIAAHPVLMGGLRGFRQLSELMGHDESRMRIWSRKTGYKPDRNWKDYRPYQYR